MEKPIRIIPADCVRDLHELTNSLYPMFKDWVPKMVKSGVYEVADNCGTRLPTEQALALIYGRK